MNNIVTLKDIVVEFDGERILDHINLEIGDKQFVTLLGPSGCGKTTTLRIIGGFITPDSGSVTFDGAVINDLPPHKRNVNTVFQRYALFPHLNVYENIAFGLRVQKLPEKEISKRVGEMLRLVNLMGYEKRNIARLSGGQQQRVAIARALVNHPKVLLLDEPLGALDLKLRKEMQIELKRIQEQLEITFIYVTHDQEEALTMSDTVVVMNGGKIQQVGSPVDIYNEPINAFVADFIGESNILSGLMIRDRLVEIEAIAFHFIHNVDVIWSETDTDSRAFLGCLCRMNYPPAVIGVYKHLVVDTLEYDRLNNAIKRRSIGRNDTNILRTDNYIHGSIFPESRVNTLEAPALNHDIHIMNKMEGYSAYENKEEPSEDEN